LRRLFPSSTDILCYAFAAAVWLSDVRRLKQAAEREKYDVEMPPMLLTHTVADSNFATGLQRLSA
jgi:hypothetical protein